MHLLQYFFALSLLRGQFVNDSRGLCGAVPRAAVSPACAAVRNDRPAAWQDAPNRPGYATALAPAGMRESLRPVWGRGAPRGAELVWHGKSRELPGRSLSLAQEGACGAQFSMIPCRFGSE